MNDWHCFFDRIDDNLANSTYRIFEPHCKTEIFNWFSREDVEKEQKEDFIQALVDFPDDCGGFYRYRAYLLAAEAINYYKDCSLGDAIALQVLKWSYAFFRQDKQDWQIVPQPLVKAARATLELTDRQRVISAFVHLVHTTESRTIRRIAAEKLGKIDPGNKSAIAALVLLLEVTQDQSAIWDINCNLMQIDPDNLAVMSTLDKLAVPNTDGCSDLDRCWYLISYAAIPLGRVDSRNKTATKALVQLMQTTTDRGDIEWAIENLEAVATGNETAINALIELIQTTNDKYICWDAISSLGKIAMGSRTAIATLTKFLQINQGDRICVVAAQALWQIDVGNINAIATLVQIVANTADRYDLKQAATYLFQFQPNNVDAISALIERIETTKGEHICLQAAISLLQFDANSELAIATLLQIIQNSDCINYRLKAAYSLLRVDPSNQLANATLVAFILERDDPNNRICLEDLCYCVEDLCKYIYKAPNAIAALTKAISFIKYRPLLSTAAYSLGKIDPGNQTAISTLIQFIHQPVEVDAINCDDYNLQRLDAADKLQKILPREQMWQVVEALKDYLSKSKQDSSYRYEACYNLIWRCAQNMPYPDFYKAWHTSS